jgi:8-oxo-dGTP pyrophosphatase MutT (NUDIX family)
LVMHRNKFGEEYYTLVGGGVGLGEVPEQTVLREVAEETTLQIANPRLVFIEEAGVPYGNQYIFLCDYAGGEISLPAESDEAKVNELGRNLHTPLWLPLDKLPAVPFLSKGLQASLLQAFAHDFPKNPQVISPNQGVYK